MLEKLLKNKAIKAAFMNQFRDIIREQNLKAIVIHIKDGENFEPELFKEDIKILTLTEYNNLITAIKNQL